MKTTVLSVLLLGALAPGCANDSDSRVSVEPNALGVTSIETTKYVDHGDRLFDLRGFDANEQEVAQVRLRIGTVDGLPGTAENDDDQGSEIVMSIDGRDLRTVSRETVLFALARAQDDSMQSFLEIPTVAERLAHDANIIVARPQAGELAFTSSTCAANQILSTPRGYQCCYDGTQTMFTRADPGSSFPMSSPAWNAQTLVVRSRNPQGTGCKASDGVSACLGKACYYGPFGYGKPSNTTPGNFANYYWRVSSSPCWGHFEGTNWNPVFGNVDGTLATGQGCPGGNSGDSNGYWDY